MAKRFFLASVGRAEAFRRGKDNLLKLAFVSKTLTDSGLNITTTKDDIRAGTGAPVQFSFYHDSNVEITLTDVLWDRNYLQAQLGAQFEEGTEDYVTDEITFDAGTKTKVYDKHDKVKEMPIPCGKEYVIWGSPKGEDNWDELEYDPTTGAISLKAEVEKATTYCIRYLGEVDNAQVAEITSTIIPEELFLIITAPIFAGDACAASKGRPAGHITFEVPRFQLNGSQEFAMNMSSNQTMSLSGTALAASSAECDSVGGKLLRIIEVIDDRSNKDNIEALQVDDQCLEVGNMPSVYGIYNDGYLKKMDNDNLTFIKGDETVNIASGWPSAGTYTVKLTGTSVKTTAEVE